MLSALSQILQPYPLLLAIGGTALGLVVGAMPGLSATMALAVLLPFTFAMDPLHGLVALGAVYMGAIYGGAFAAILVNTPGTPSSIATTFEGYPMAKKGEAEDAITAATVASTIGGLFGVGALLFLAPPLAQFALRFGPAEYFWIAILGLTLIGSLSEGPLLKGMAGGVIGVLISLIGIAPLGGESRFGFGLPALQGGVHLVVALIGMFAIPELLSMAGTGKAALAQATESVRRSGGTFGMIKRVLSMPGNLLRSCIIGEIVSIVPGAGGNIAGLVSYNEAKRYSKHPERYGKGEVEGLVASEAANNVTVAGSMVPLLTLGIPGAPPDALILGVLLMHGLRPGAELFTVSGTMTYGFILSMGLAALLLLPIGLLAGTWIYRAVVRVPAYFLVPTIALMTIFGSFALRNNTTDVIIMVVLGLAAYLLKELGFHPAPIVLGLILGPIAETGFVTTMLLGQAYAVPALRLFDNTLSQVLIALVVLFLLAPALSNWRRSRKERMNKGGA
ncbi:MAG: tripartite tricarboxylate transporter permease [Trueperaceae bacterium]